MRTTITLDDDVHAEVVRRSALLGASLGAVVSELVRRGLQVAPPVREANGLVIFDPPGDSPKVTAGMVRDALSDFP